ncbi:PREDICTED: putative pentatricopeptide repeat-containing protein At3g13770, mitochondrial [Nelumbo nucifera]|uniref:Pentatricopeptide repeat-containing protein At3g13770, mitochondrial n=1 Tax=Nelumbo nucifera TaxID=4432 RepID=A0A1U8AC83_NELNU|nr:PREDICTED: putative pentatricopeptide repeat-containing protein At3g13770, mitochondrial [Nelumbo nucifera]
MRLQTRSLLSFARSIVVVVIPKTTTRASFSFALLKLDGSYHVDVFSSNRKIDNLIKCGRLDSAVEMFEAMPIRDVVSCNLVIAGHARHGFQELALDLFKEMVFRSLRESPSTCSLVLGICSDVGFYQEGLQVHCRVVLLGFNANLFVGSTLIDLYPQASYLNPAMQLFDELPGRSLATWNLVLRGFYQLGRSYEMLGFYLKMKSDVGVDPNGVTFCYLIYVCARHRMGREGLKMLETMIQEDLKPDVVTFLSMLMGCRHSCLVREEQLIFESTETIHAVYLDKRHYSCMVDLLGCIVHQNEKVGRRAAIALLELNPDNPTMLLQASSFYSEIGDTKMFMKIREYKETSEMRKGTCYNFIESINHGYS